MLHTADMNMNYTGNSRHENWKELHNIRLECVALYTGAEKEKD